MSDTPPATFPVHIFLNDVGKDQAPGVNPLQVDIIQVPFESTSDRRREAAKKAVAQHMQRGELQIGISESPGYRINAILPKNPPK